MNIGYCPKASRLREELIISALAEAEQIPFITADEIMYNAVKKDLKWVKWLGRH